MFSDTDIGKSGMDSETGENGMDSKAGENGYLIHCCLLVVSYRDKYIELCYNYSCS